MRCSVFDDLRGSEQASGGVRVGEAGCSEIIVAMILVSGYRANEKRNDSGILHTATICKNC